MTDAEIQAEAFAIVLREQQEASSSALATAVAEIREQWQASIAEVQTAIANVQPGAQNVVFPAPQVRNEIHPSEMRVEVQTIPAPLVDFRPTITPSTAIVENRMDMTPQIIVDMTPVAEVLAEALGRIVAALEARQPRAWKIHHSDNTESTAEVA